MSSHDDREEALFEQSLGRPPEEREAFVRQECGEDVELAERVLSLLRSHESAGEFLEEGPARDSFEVASRLEQVAPGEERPGDQVGRYRLLELIGQGAWGYVWIARQTADIDRQVAIKILKVGMDTKDFLARFEAERQMLAMMDHPNIASVLDAGATKRGRPYLVMELVKGIQILEFADKNRLGVRERVKLFAKVCRAMHHAHRKGVVHRDLKPSNILVSAQYDEALPKVIDFGVAKSNQLRLSDKTVYTSMHTFMGTPVYSSPEQLEFAGREVDARSDIYSLGALLYELVCGAAPFDGGSGGKKDLGEFVRRVREEDPLRPSQRFSKLPDEDRKQIASRRRLSASKLESLLKGDLDWITVKCLEKDPARRYATAKDLADDLRAFLDNQVVTATAPSPIYRLRRLVSRNRPSYASWVEMSAVAAACLAVAFYYGVRRPSFVDQTPLEISEDSSIQLTDKSIAVLPLENLSPNVENAYFAGAIHGEFIDQLDKISDLRVIDRTSVKRYQDSTKPSWSIGEELGVRYLIEGSVYREGKRVAISLSLIDLETRQRMWSRTYERNTEDLFSLRSEVALDVAGELQAFLSPDEVKLVEEFPTRSREAYDLYLKSREYWGSGEEIPFLRKAIEIDPDFYEAWTSIAWRGLFRFSGASKGDSELLDMAKEAIEQMGRIKPNHVLTHSLRAGYEIHANHDLEAALTHRLKWKAAGGTGGEIGWSYLQLGRLDEARYTMEDSLKRNPLGAALNSRLYGTYTCLGMWNEASELLEKQLREWAIQQASVDQNPTKRYERYLAQHDFLVRGGRDNVVEAFGKLPGLLDSPMGELWSSLVLREYSDALQQLDEIRYDPDNPFPVFHSGHGAPGIELILTSQLNNSLDLEPFTLVSALVHFARDERDAWLARAAEAKSYWEEAIASYHKVDPNHLAFLAICHALEGDRTRMEATIPKIRELTETVNWQFRAQAKCEMKLAIAYLVLGDENKAIDLLEYASELHSPMFINRELELWFIFDRLKGNPRFDALLNKDQGSRRRAEFTNTPSDEPSNGYRKLDTKLKIFPIPREKSIAVMPLENLSPDPNDAFFADGIHEDLLTYLGRVSELTVIGRSSTLQYRQSTKPASTIGEELGVSFLMRGSLRRDGEDIRVSVRLIEAGRGTQVWAGNYDRPFSDVFGIQTEIAKEVAEELHAVLSPEEIADIEKPLTDNDEAYLHYLTAKHLNYESYEQWFQTMHKAVELDPRFYIAWRDIATKALYRYRVETNRQETELLDIASHALEQLRTAPNPDYYLNKKAMWVYSVDNDLQQAIELLEQVRTVDHNYEVHDLPWKYMEVGRMEEALPLMEEAYRKNPYNIGTVYRLLLCYQSLGLWNKGRQVINRIRGQSRGYYEEFAFNRASLDYLESGEREAYVREIESFVAETDFENEGRPVFYRLTANLISRNFDKALRLLEGYQNRNDDIRLLALASGGWEFCFNLKPIDLVRALLWRELGELGKSRAEAEKAIQYLEPIAQHPKADPSELYNLAICYALLGQRESMDRIIDEVRERIKSPNWAYRRGVLTEMHIAVAHIVLGERETAIETLEKASKRDSPIFFERELDLWFMFDALKGNPRFDALIGEKTKSSGNRLLNTELEIVLPPDEKSIAILPFENISGREEDEPYANGLHSTLWTEVSQIRDLKPTSMTSVLTYRGANKPLTQIASELNVANVLTGDVQIMGGSMRVNVRLIEAATDTRRWSKIYDRPLTAENYFSIQSEITISIADSLNVVLTPKEQDRLDDLPTRSTEALKAFLEARDIVDSTIQTRRDEGIALLEQAIELDPTFTSAYIYLARAHFTEPNVAKRYENWRMDSASEAEAALTIALGLDENVVDAHMLKGRVHAWRYQFDADPIFKRADKDPKELVLAKRSLDRALELNPNHAEAYSEYGTLLLEEFNQVGKRETSVQRLALAWLRKAVELDPRSPPLRSSLGFLYQNLGEYQEAREQFETALRIDPEFAAGYFALGGLLKEAFAAYDEVIALSRKAVAIDPTRLVPHIRLLDCYWTLGDQAEAFRWHKASIGSGLSYDKGGKGDQAASRSMDAFKKGDHEEYVQQLRIAVRELSNYAVMRRRLLNADIREGRFELALEQYRSLFPPFFENEVSIEKDEYIEGSYMHRDNQAQAVMEIAEILLHLGQKERAYYLLDQGWDVYKEYPKRMGWNAITTTGYGVRDAVRFALRNEKEEAIKAIRKGVDEGFRDRLELESSHFDSIREEPKFKTAMEIVEADWARQLANVRRMEANGELAPIPDDPRYDLDAPAKISSFDTLEE